MAKKISSSFAILDVKGGRVELARRIRDFKGFGQPVRIPVTIRGYIVSQCGDDDGTSIEFEVAVTDAVERVR